MRFIKYLFFVYIIVCVNSNIYAKDLVVGIGGDIETFLSKCKMAHARRVFSLDERHRFVLLAEDLQQAKALLEQNQLDGDESEIPFGLYI